MGSSAKHLNAYLCMSQHSVYGHASGPGELFLPDLPGKQGEGPVA
jgi:hypothetical protein